MTYNGGGGRPGNGWDGHLPSDKMERAILNAMEGIEDEDGKKSAFLNTDEQEVACARARISNARACQRRATRPALRVIPRALARAEDRLPPAARQHRTKGRARGRSTAQRSPIPAGAGGQGAA